MPKTRTLRLSAVENRTLAPSDRAALDQDLSRARQRSRVVDIPLDLIDETPQMLNSRQDYDDESLAELADSIRVHGVQQAVAVLAQGERYQLIFGKRRFLASRLAGLPAIPAVVRSGLGPEDLYVINLVENAQRKELSGHERMDAIRRLEGMGKGVREISRLTGMSPGTISRWLHIAQTPSLAEAVEAERIDIGRAMTLAPLRKAPDELAGLLQEAAALPREQLNERVKSVLLQNTYSVDDARLADIERKLSLVRTVTEVGHAHLRRIVRTALDLLQQVETTQLAGAKRPSKKAQPEIVINGRVVRRGGEA